MFPLVTFSYQLSLFIHIQFNRHLLLDIFIFDFRDLFCTSSRATTHQTRQNRLLVPQAVSEEKIIKFRPNELSCNGVAMNATSQIQTTRQTSLCFFRLAPSPCAVSLSFPFAVSWIKYQSASIAFFWRSCFLSQFVIHFPSPEWIWFVSSTCEWSALMILAP